MNIIFRADASLDIGNGHVIRCLTLATELKRQGASCRFVCSTDEGNLIEIIRQQGFEADAIRSGLNRAASSSASPIPVHIDYDWKVDAELTASALSNVMADWLIVDHYALDARWEVALRPSYSHLMVIDDLANRPHLGALLLDQNLGREQRDYDALVPPGSTVLTGPRFALLKPEFSKLRNESLERRRSDRIDRLLITMGGADTEDATGKVLEALKKCTLPAQLKVTVVMGPHAPFRERIIALARSMPWETEVLINVSNMAELMAKSDLAIGAAGTTSWERCSLGLPTLLLILADNQIAVAAAQQKLNSAILLSDMNALAAQLPKAVALVSAPGVLARMVQAAAEVTDGEGVYRVIEHLTAQTHVRNST